MKTRQIIAACCTIALFAVPCLGDDITVGQLPYSDVEIVAVTQTKIAFRVHERTLSKPLGEVKRITLSGEPAFNEAERLYAAGKYAEAAKAYQFAQEQTQSVQSRMLAKYRQALARKQMKRPGPGKTDAPTKKPKRCSLCSGKGTVPCKDCRGTGKGICRDCSGTGRVPCPVCKGEWRQQMCNHCHGKGYVWEKREVKVRKRIGCEYEEVERDFKVPCKQCEGRGYLWFCPKCSNSRIPRFRGTALCPMCLGKGRSGPCPTCKGTGRVTCPACGGKSLAQQEAKKQPKGGNASPDALAKRIREALSAPSDAPSQTELTTLQKQLAERTAGKAPNTIGVSYIGKEVAWLLTLKDVALAEDSESFILQANSPKGALVIASLSRSAEETLLTLRKHDPIELKGTIKSCRFDPPLGSDEVAPNERRVFVVELDSAAVTPSSLTKRPLAPEE